MAIKIGNIFVCAWCGDDLLGPFVTCSKLGCKGRKTIRRTTAFGFYGGNPYAMGFKHDLMDISTISMGESIQQMRAEKFRTQHEGLFD